MHNPEHFLPATEIVEQEPFQERVSRRLFEKWCTINDSIEPKFIDRKEWRKQRKSGVLRGIDDTRKTLLLPNDLHLWEMPRIMATVDRDTFIQRPERWQEKRREIEEFSQLLCDAGTYVAQRLDAIDKKEGRDLAAVMAKDFYAYGEALLLEAAPHERVQLRIIAGRSLDLSAVERVERWLAGESLYQSRSDRVHAEVAGTTNSEEREKVIELHRRQTLKQFFTVLQKAYELQERDRQKTNLSERNETDTAQSITSTHTSFADKIEYGVRMELEIPKREFFGAIFRRGKEKLLREMEPGDTDDVFLGIQAERQKLSDTLQLSKHRAEISALREVGDLKKATKKELKIVEAILKEVGRLEYDENAYNPTDMIEHRRVNCAGKALLNGALLQEAGITYLNGHAEIHAFMGIVTSNGVVYVGDSKEYGVETAMRRVYNKDILGEVDGRALTVKDITALAKNPNPRGLNFSIPSPDMVYSRVFRWGSLPEEHVNKRISFFSSELGEQILLYDSLSAWFYEQHRYKEALEASKMAVAGDPQDDEVWLNYGNILEKTGRTEEAMAAYTKAVIINPDSYNANFNYGIALTQQGRLTEARQILQAIVDRWGGWGDELYELGVVLYKLGEDSEASDRLRDFLGKYSGDDDRQKHADELIRKLSAKFNKSDAVSP